MSHNTENAFSILDNRCVQPTSQPAVDSLSKPPKPARSKTITDEFNEVIRVGVKRTGFLKERIEAFLPRDLLALYRSVNKPSGKLPDDEMGKKLFRFVQDDIFGVLPDYSSPAIPSQSDGFNIGGKKVAILMKKDIACRQLTSALRGTPSNFISACHGKLKEEFSFQDIKDVVLNTGYGNINRQLVANIIRISDEMKATPK